MAGTPITLQEWRPFCEEFTRKHRGWLVNLTKHEQSATARGAGTTRTRLATVAENLPFWSLEVQRDQNGASISLVVGKNEERLVHTIDKAVRLQLERTAEGADRVLHVCSAEGEVMKMQFVTPHYGATE